MWNEKDAQPTERTAAYEDCQEESIQEFKNVYQATSLQSQYTFTQLLSKVFLNKYNKTLSCDLTWSIVTRCTMKKNLTCSAAALALTLTSRYIRQYMRLIVHFYSKLTLNHRRVFVVTFFCDHMCLYTLWAAVVHYKSSLKTATHGSVLFPATGSSTQPNCAGKPQHWFAVPLSHMSMHKVYLKLFSTWKNERRESLWHRTALKFKDKRGVKTLQSCLIYGWRESFSGLSRLSFLFQNDTRVRRNDKQTSTAREATLGENQHNGDRLLSDSAKRFI